MRRVPCDPRDIFKRDRVGCEAQILQPSEGIPTGTSNLGSDHQPTAPQRWRSSLSNAIGHDSLSNQLTATHCCTLPGCGHLPGQAAQCKYRPNRSLGSLSGRIASAIRNSLAVWSKLRDQRSIKNIREKKTVVVVCSFKRRPHFLVSTRETRI